MYSIYKIRFIFFVLRIQRETKVSRRHPLENDCTHITICIECHRSFKSSKVSLMFTAQCVSRRLFRTYDLTMRKILAMLITR